MLVVGMRSCAMRKTLTWWRKEMWAYYVENCQRLGKEAREDMPLICERFKVVYP